MTNNLEHYCLTSFIKTESSVSNPVELLLQFYLTLKISEIVLYK
jgi:hypothetical protein